MAEYASAGQQAAHHGVQDAILLVTSEDRPQMFCCCAGVLKEKFGRPLAVSKSAVFHHRELRFRGNEGKIVPHETDHMGRNRSGGKEVLQRSRGYIPRSLVSIGEPFGMLGQVLALAQWAKKLETKTHGLVEQRPRVESGFQTAMGALDEVVPASEIEDD